MQAGEWVQLDQGGGDADGGQDKEADYVHQEEEDRLVVNGDGDGESVRESDLYIKASNVVPAEIYIIITDIKIKCITK